MTTSSERANPRLAAALRYARANWPVFPCIPGEKVPATRHGFLDATTEPDKITWWWMANPERNVAIATGLPGPDVLDVDVRADGNGFAAFSRLRREGFVDGASAYVRTPTGGLHAYFAGSEQGNGRLPGHHLDFRSRGGYIVAPPSVIGGKPYELIKRQERTAGLDWAAVTRLLDPQPQHRADRAPEQPLDVGRLAGWVAGLPEGNRNEGLFWAANRALEAGLTDLGELAEAARLTGLDEREIARTLASARRNADRLSGAEPMSGRTAGPAIPQREAQARGHGTSGRALSPEPGRQPQTGRQPDLAIRDWTSALDRAGIAPADEDKEAEPR